jgi:ubiquinone/menaquinone biosynthesis C-methylase UbiE
MNLEEAKKIIRKVEKDYDLIAKEWNTTRTFLRAGQMKIGEKIKKEQRVLDIGCGNGILYSLFAQKAIDYTGLDISSKLLALARKRINQIKSSKDKVRLVKGNILALPFSDNYFDWVFAFAVLHHLPSQELQRQAVKEIFRVLKSKGKVVISVWNLFSDYLEKKFHLSEWIKKRPPGWEENDFLIPWKATPQKKIERYIYRFTPRELKELFQLEGFKNIKCFWENQEGKPTSNSRKAFNIILMAQK